MQATHPLEERRPDELEALGDGDVLAYHRTAREQVDRLGLGPLARSTRVLLWGLRAYVVFMAVVVALQVAHTWH